jgi:hypothetical protein
MGSRNSLEVDVMPSVMRCLHPNKRLGVTLKGVPFCDKDFERNCVRAHTAFSAFSAFSRNSHLNQILDSYVVK